MSFITELEIGYFRDHLSLIKKTIDEDLKKLEQRDLDIKNSGVKEITTEDGQHWDPYDELVDENFFLKEREQLMYKIYVIGIFVFIEEQINNVCISLEKEYKLLFSYKDLKGTGVGRSIDYFKKVTKKDFLVDLETRKNFEIVRIIRNSLVHQDGQIKDNDKNRVESYIKEYPHMLSFNQNYNIKINYDYAKSLINLCEKINFELREYDFPLWQ